MRIVLRRKLSARLTPLLVVWLAVSLAVACVDDHDSLQKSASGVCVPDCDGKKCGDDGCGGSCGECTWGICVMGDCTCVPSCEDRECGSDGCAGSCGECSEGFSCSEGQCEEHPCEPECNGAECGADGCGGDCGECAEEKPLCKDFQCVAECVADCDGKKCGTDGCGGSCGECDGEQDICSNGLCECQPECGGKECGDDGCSGACGACDTCKTECENGVCFPKLKAGSGCHDNDVYWKDSCGIWGGIKEQCGPLGCDYVGDVCNPCDVQAPVEEICNGKDDDCDGSTDEPSGEGAGEELCDDDNVCTVDSCQGSEGCEHEPLSAGECVDGDLCTVGDHCEQGICVGTPTDCDDDNPCTDDWCDDFGGCDHKENSSPCDDENLCTENEGCFQGACGPGVPMDCDDDNPCTTDGCEPKTGCFSAPKDGPCDDGNPCTKDDVCSQGNCVGGGQTVCDDSNVCTTDSCDPVEGCVHSLNELPCDDYNTCTTGDVCSDGECKGEGSLECDDENPCTKDICLPEGGCDYENLSVACNDNNACTVDDLCQGGNCVGGSPLPCDDETPCTTDSCDPEDGCLHLLNELPCDDKDACTSEDTCQLGDCVGEPVTCNDDNVCTTDACAPEFGCTFELNDSPCDDGDACTTGDYCHLGECIGAGMLTCDDFSSCTSDSCDPDLGCVFVDEPDAWTCGEGMMCESGQCIVCAPDCPQEDLLCTIWGNAGDVVSCPIRIVREYEESDTVTGCDFDLLWSSSKLELQDFQDEVCIGEVCAPNSIPSCENSGTDCTWGSLWPSEHDILAVPQDLADWIDGGTLLMFHPVSAFTPLTSAHLNTDFEFVGEDAEFLMANFLVNYTIVEDESVSIWIQDGHFSTPGGISLPYVVTDVGGEPTILVCDADGPCPTCGPACEGCCGNGHCDTGCNETCVTCPQDCGECDPTICALTGTEGELLECPIHLVQGDAADLPAVQLQFTAVFDEALAQVHSLETCGELAPPFDLACTEGGGECDLFGDPTVFCDVEIEVCSQCQVWEPGDEAIELATGHAVSTCLQPPANCAANEFDVLAWSTQSEPLSEAVLVDGWVIGRSLLMSIRFSLLQDVQQVSYVAVGSENFSAVSEKADALPAGVVQSSSPNPAHFIVTGQ